MASTSIFEDFDVNNINEEQLNHLKTQLRVGKTKSHQRYRQAGAGDGRGMVPDGRYETTNYKAYKDSPYWSDIASHLDINVNSENDITHLHNFVDNYNLKKDEPSTPSVDDSSDDEPINTKIPEVAKPENAEGLEKAKAFVNDYTQDLVSGERVKRLYGNKYNTNSFQQPKESEQNAQSLLAKYQNAYRNNAPSSPVDKPQSQKAPQAPTSDAPSPFKMAQGLMGLNTSDKDNEGNLNSTSPDADLAYNNFLNGVNPFRDLSFRT